MKTLNIFNSLPSVKQAVIIIFAVYIAVVYVSCNPIKTAEKRIQSSEQGINFIGQLWAKTHPCANDTVYASRADTITTLDTMYQFLPGVAASPAAGTSIHDTLRQFVNITRYVHDTVTNNIVDTRALHMQQQKTQQDVRQLSALQASLFADTALAKKRWWIIFIIIVAAAVITVVAIWLKLKTGVVSAAVTSIKNSI